MLEHQTDGQSPEPNDTLLPDAPDSAAQVDNTADATDAENGNDATDDDTGRKPGGVQKRIAEITREKYDALRKADAAEVEARLLREQLARFNGDNADAGKLAPATDGTPTLDQFETYEDFETALVDYRVEQALAKRQQAEQAKAVEAAYQSRVDALRAKAPDYDAVVSAPDLPVTASMAQAIYAIENGPEVAYHLGTNKTEAARIAALPPVMQFAEIGRLSERLSATPPPTRRANPPAPVQTVNGLNAGASTPDESKMTEAEWISWRRTIKR